MLNHQKHSWFEETKQAVEPGSDRAEMLELSDQEFKTITMNMLRCLMEKAGNIQKQMCNKAEKWKF